MADGKFVAYYRVSTERQGRSGLGLEAQQAKVREFLNGGSWDLVDTYTEVESGKRADRPELLNALAACRKRKATLVVAKLDRLARNTKFLLTVLDSGVPVTFCDLPQVPDGAVGRFMLTQMASVAELERGLTSERTKAALRAAKARGVDLGTNGKALARRYRSEALGRAVALSDTIRALQATCPTVRALAAALNARGVPTTKGGKWHVSTVHRLLRRLDENQTRSAA